MRIFPMIPIWLMTIISIILGVIIFDSKKWKITIYKIGIILLLFIINLRIMLPNDNAQVVTNDLDVLFVVDNTISMYALDYGSNKTERMEAVKNDCKYIINNLTGARFSLIVFNNTSQISIPYTYDTNIVAEAIDSIRPLISYYAKGSSLNVPYNDMKTALLRQSQGEKRKKIIFYISDGEITSEEKLESFSQLKDYIDNGAILGYGTLDGGYMLIDDDYSGQKEYVEDTSSWPYIKAISKLDEDNLNKIAKDLNLDYIRMDKQKDIDQTLKEVKKDVALNTNELDITSYDDIYYIFIIPLFILLLLIYYEYKRSSL